NNMRKLYMKKIPCGRYPYMVRLHQSKNTTRIENYLDKGFGPNRRTMKSWYKYTVIDRIYLERKDQILRLKLVFPDAIKDMFEIVQRDCDNQSEQALV